MKWGSRHIRGDKTDFVERIKEALVGRCLLVIPTFVRYEILRQAI